MYESLSVFRIVPLEYKNELEMHSGVVTNAKKAVRVGHKHTNMPQAEGGKGMACNANKALQTLQLILVF